jgi:hypothetical protein
MWETMHLPLVIAMVAIAKFSPKKKRTHMVLQMADSLILFSEGLYFHGSPQSGEVLCQFSFVYSCHS